MNNPAAQEDTPRYCFEPWGGIQNEKSPFRGIGISLTSYHFVTAEGNDCLTSGCVFEAFSASGKNQFIGFYTLIGFFPLIFCVKFYELSCP